MDRECENFRLPNGSGATENGRTQNDSRQTTAAKIEEIRQTLREQVPNARLPPVPVYHSNSTPQQIAAVCLSPLFNEDRNRRISGADFTDSSQHSSTSANLARPSNSSDIPITDYQGRKHLTHLVQELLGYCEVLEEIRRKAVSEALRLRTANAELSRMLKDSNTREQQNIAEVEKQRQLIVQFQQKHRTLTQRANEELNKLAEQRDMFKNRLEAVETGFERRVVENEQLRRACEAQAIECQHFQATRVLYADALREKQTLQAEVESLRLDNSKLQNERNALLSENNKLQGRIYELESETTSNKRIDGFASRCGGEGTLDNVDDSLDFLSMDDTKILESLMSFNQLNDEQKLQHFEGLLQNYRRAKEYGAKYCEYTRVLMLELDERGHHADQRHEEMGGQLTSS